MALLPHRAQPDLLSKKVRTFEGMTRAPGVMRQELLKLQAFGRQRNPSAPRQEASSERGGQGRQPHDSVTSTFL